MHSLTAFSFKFVTASFLIVSKLTSQASFYLINIIMDVLKLSDKT